MTNTNLCVRFPSHPLTSLTHYRRCHISPAATKSTSVDKLWAFKCTCDSDDPLTDTLLAVKHQHTSYFSDDMNCLLRSRALFCSPARPNEKEWESVVCALFYLPHWNTVICMSTYCIKHLRPWIKALTGEIIAMHDLTSFIIKGFIAH